MVGQMFRNNIMNADCDKLLRQQLLDIVNSMDLNDGPRLDDLHSECIGQTCFDKEVRVQNFS